MRYITLILAFHLFSCLSPGSNRLPNDARLDIRLGNKFYSILLNKEGKSYVIKGSGTNYRDSLVISISDTSQGFIIDSVDVFFSKLDRLRSLKPTSVYHLDAPRIEIYYPTDKVFDTYQWDENFWDLVRPIMTQLPAGFNPFRLDEQPFD